MGGLRIPVSLMVLFFLCAVIGNSTAKAVTVILKTNAEPIRGFLVSEDERQIVVRIELPGGTTTERTIEKSEIDLMHRPVSVERLEGLDPARPKEYRDYAEELAEKRIDPEARQLGLRLYVIAAHLDPAGLGRSSLLGMTALAATPEDERRYRALAFLLDPEHDRSVLKSVDAASARTPSTVERKEDVFTQGVVRALELLRKGRTQEAGQQLRRSGMQEALAPYRDIISYEDLLDACRSRVQRGPAAPPELAAKIVALELKLLGVAVSSDSGAAARSWSLIAPAQLAKPARPLTMETITEFDPRLCVYRDGVWVAP